MESHGAFDLSALASSNLLSSLEFFLGYVAPRDVEVNVINKHYSQLLVAYWIFLLPTMNERNQQLCIIGYAASTVYRSLYRREHNSSFSSNNVQNFC